LIATIMLIALVAFEIFNFDTTKYALANLLGDANFVGLEWAAILAIAFCAIDFAGLARVFTPEKGMKEPKEVWYLMGAWLLGATMNAVMTWWAVSLTLLNHEFGNEVLSRAQLLKTVPIFVAVLVWLTRILFIGAISVAGDHLFDFGRRQPAAALPTKAPQLTAPRQAARLNPNTGQSVRSRQQAPVVEQPTQVYQTPPMRPSRPVPAGVAARPRYASRPGRTSPNPMPMNMQGREQ
jgi:hypothetical protein